MLTDALRLLRKSDINLFGQWRDVRPWRHGEEKAQMAHYGSVKSWRSAALVDRLPVLERQSQSGKSFPSRIAR
jgi:hypothetical protein